MSQTPAAKRAAARQRLRAWGATYAKRDTLVMDGRDAGISVTDIASLTGLGTSSVYRIIERHRAPLVVCRSADERARQADHQDHDTESSTA